MGEYEAGLPALRFYVLNMKVLTFFDGSYYLANVYAILHHRIAWLKFI
jgi:hypothetical protein